MGKTRTIVINARPQQVFDYLCDFNKHGEWNGDPDDTDSELPKGSVRVGTVVKRWHTRLEHRNGGSVEDVVINRQESVTHLVPNQLLGIEASVYRHEFTGAELRTAYTLYFALQPAEFGTQLTIQHTDTYLSLGEILNHLIRLPLLPFRLHPHGKMLYGILEKIKYRVEREQGLRSQMIGNIGSVPIAGGNKMPGFSFGSTYSVDRSREITCDQCDLKFAPLKDFSIRSMMFRSLLIFPGRRYFRRHFVCPGCGAELYHKMEQFKAGVRGPLEY